MTTPDPEVTLTELIRQKSEEIGMAITIHETDFLDGLDSENMTRHMDAFTSQYSDDITILVHSNLNDETKRAVILNELRHVTNDGDGISDFDFIISTIEKQRQPEEENPQLLTSSVIIPDQPTSDGILIKSTSLVWNEIVEQLNQDWTQAYNIPSRIWEEIVAGAFYKSGFDHVVLTPRSGDLGRDVIATKTGFGSVKIIGSVKAYGPQNPIPYDDIRAIVGVMAMEHDVSKAMLTTTSFFPPNLHKDHLIQSLLPTRLELLDGPALLSWLKSIQDENN